MQKRNENKFRMFNAVLEILNGNKTIWQAAALFVQIVNKFTASLTAIGETRKVTESDSKGHTLEKSSLEETLINSIGALTSSLYLLAKNSGNKVLMEKVNYNESELANAREGELVSIAETVAALGRENLAQAADYDFDEAEVKALEDLAARFKAVMPAPRATIAERKAANEKLNRLIAETTELLDDELDRMMLKYKNSHPDFYNTYFNARMIMDYGIRHKPEAEEVANASANSEK